MGLLFYSILYLLVIIAIHKLYIYVQTSFTKPVMKSTVLTETPDDDHSLNDEFTMHLSNSNDGADSDSDSDSDDDLGAEFNNALNM